MVFQGEESFIHSSSFLSAYYIPNTILDARDAAKTAKKTAKKTKIHVFFGGYFLVKGR